MPTLPATPTTGFSLWERISLDPKYLQAKQRIQRRYGLPLPFDIRFEPGKWRGWLGLDNSPSSPGAARGRAFLKEARALFKKFQVPESWHDDFIAAMAGTLADAAPATRAQERWAAAWLETVRSGARIMSQRSLPSIRKHAGGLETVRRAAEAMGVHLLLVEDEDGGGVVAASLKPFHVIG